MSFQTTQHITQHIPAPSARHKAMTISWTILQLAQPATARRPPTAICAMACVPLWRMRAHHPGQSWIFVQNEGNFRGWIMGKSSPKWCLNWKHSELFFFWVSCLVDILNLEKGWFPVTTFQHSNLTGQVSRLLVLLPPPHIPYVYAFYPDDLHGLHVESLDRQLK